MILLIHGPDLVNSRNHLGKLKAGKEVIVIDSRSEEAWWEKLNQFSIFAPELIVVDWFKEKQIKFIPKDFNTEIVFWSEDSFKQTEWANRVVFFPQKSVNIFKLADAFGLRKIKPTQVYLQQALTEKTSPELIVSILSRQLKLISMALSGKPEEISKSTFLRNKIADQAQLWTEKSVIRGFRMILEADLAIKSGVKPEVALSLAMAKVNPSV